VPHFGAPTIKKFGFFIRPRRTNITRGNLSPLIAAGSKCAFPISGRIFQTNESASAHAPAATTRRRHSIILISQRRSRQRDRLGRTAAILHRICEFRLLIDSSRHGSLVHARLGIREKRPKACERKPVRGPEWRANCPRPRRWSPPILPADRFQAPNRGSFAAWSNR